MTLFTMGFHAAESPAHLIEPGLRAALLLGGLVGLTGLGGAAGALGLRFLLRRVTLRVALVLLGLAFALEILAIGHLASDLLGLALDAFDDAFDGLFDSVALSHARSLPR